jgi:hypothetical protein
MSPKFSHPQTTNITSTSTISKSLLSAVPVTSARPFAAFQKVPLSSGQKVKPVPVTSSRQYAISVQ